MCFCRLLLEMFCHLDNLQQYLSLLLSMPRLRRCSKGKNISHCKWQKKKIANGYFLPFPLLPWNKANIQIFFADEAEIEKLKAAVFKAVRESNFSKAKEIQQKIDKILMNKTQASTNQNSLQGEKDYQLFVFSIIWYTYNESNILSKNEHPFFFWRK